VQIKRADRSDVGRLAENRLEFVRSIRNVADPLDFFTRTKAYFLQHIEDGSLISYLALDQGKIVSSCILCVYTTLPIPSCLSGKSGLLLNVYTIPAYRRLGLAERLLQELIADAKQAGVGKIHLGSTADSRLLYKKLGFKDLGHEMELCLE
jgi:ribosomal protein S18 acetylase RimI-like enzyme